MIPLSSTNHLKVTLKTTTIRVITTTIVPLLALVGQGMGLDLVEYPTLTTIHSIFTLMALLMSKAPDSTLPQISLGLTAEVDNLRTTRLVASKITIVVK